MVTGWDARGYRDSTRAHIAEFVHPEEPRDERALAAAGRLPPWMGCEPLHRSHRAALRKDPAYYAPLLSDTPAELDYVWPEPPGPEPAPGPRTDWVVRGTVADDLVLVAARPGEEPGAWPPVARRELKRDRQVRRLTDVIARGDRVVVPGGDDDGLRIGVVTGEYRYDDGRGAHVRPVQWLGALPRRALDFPAALQDPQAVFALHDEPVVAALEPAR